MSEYEKKRQLLINENQKKLLELGLLPVSIPQPPRKKVYSKSKRNIIRKSSRLRKDQNEEQQNEQNETVETVYYKKRMETSFRANTLVSDHTITVSFPFTLLSIQVTVWNLGKLVDDPRYWSSAACQYRHPYPIGYTCSKYHFGREWIMTITESEEGPLFHVIGEKKVYTGYSPTSPWTDICIDLQSKVGKTRISGPLFFGFSDPKMIRIIECMQDFEKIGGTIQQKKACNFTVKKMESGSLDFCLNSDLIDRETKERIKIYCDFP
ncbi:hypothetical protein HK103_004567 [Boothiomyces macroporosus]|uniref:Uncharacterized protein n=1 Tax=Boothiomyces macroporosus TaxID=261099 RepID=A0AAD5Y5P6_9FUNG|nr:hypothetical protein HK103_004567 [Boothiomyces macroporosus]